MAATRFSDILFPGWDSFSGANGYSSMCRLGAILRWHLLRTAPLLFRTVYDFQFREPHTAAGSRWPLPAMVALYWSKPVMVHYEDAKQLLQ